MDLNRTVDLVCPLCGGLVSCKVQIDSVAPSNGYLHVSFRNIAISHDCQGQ